MAGGVGVGQCRRSTRPASPGGPASGPNRSGAVLVPLPVRAQVGIHALVLVFVLVTAPVSSPSPKRQPVTPRSVLKECSRPLLRLPSPAVDDGPCPAWKRVTFRARWTEHADSMIRAQTEDRSGIHEVGDDGSPARYSWARRRPADSAPPTGRGGACDRSTWSGPGRLVRWRQNLADHRTRQAPCGCDGSRTAALGPRTGVRDRPGAGCRLSRASLSVRNLRCAHGGRPPTMSHDRRWKDALRDRTVTESPDCLLPKREGSGATVILITV